MVSTLSIIFMVITGIVTLFGPIVAAVIFYRKVKYPLIALFVGVGVFFVFQIIFRIPLLQLVLPNFQWYKTLTTQILPYALFLGFTAGLVEEVGRYIAYKTILKKQLSWESAVAFGMGHGGIESILLVGLTYINNLLMSVFINTGVFDKGIAPTLPSGTAEIIKSALIDTPTYLFLVGGVERIITFIIHIGFSVLIMVGIKKGKGLLYMVIAILIHMLVDSSAVLLSHYGISALLIEVYLAFYAIVAMVYVVRTYKTYQNRNNEHKEQTIDA